MSFQTLLLEFGSSARRYLPFRNTQSVQSDLAYLGNSSNFGTDSFSSLLAVASVKVVSLTPAAMRPYPTKTEQPFLRYSLEKVYFSTPARKFPSKVKLSSIPRVTPGQSPL